MPKESTGPNKSQAIRELYTATPKMPVREAISTLASKGIKVKPGHVYMVLGSMRGKAKRHKRKRAKVSTEKIGMGDAVQIIVDLRALAERAGGMANLKRLVDVLAG